MKKNSSVCSSPLKSCLLGLDSGEKLIALVPPLLSKNDQCKYVFVNISFLPTFTLLVFTRCPEPIFSSFKINFAHPELICNCFLHSNSTLLTLNCSFLASAASCILLPRTPSRNPGKKKYDDNNPDEEKYDDNNDDLSIRNV